MMGMSAKKHFATPDRTLTSKSVVGTYQGVHTKGKLSF